MSVEAAVPSDTGVRSRAMRERRPAEAPSEPRRLPRYVVIVEDDDIHSYPYVIEVLQKVCGHDRPRAYQLTNQVHFRGQAAVWVGPLEHAELKRDLIRGFGPDHFGREPVTTPLSVRIEPLPEA